MDSVLSPEKVAELRRAVDRTLRDANVYNKVREVLAEHTARDGTLGAPSTDRILGLVQEKGVLSSLIDSVGSSGNAAAAAGGGGGVASCSSSPLTASASRGLSGERHLHVRMLGGRAFLEHLDCDPVATTTLSGGGTPGAGASAGGDVLVAHVQFGTQRFVSEEVPCLCDPDFADSFLVGLDAELQAQQRTNAALTRHSGSRDLLRLTTQLHVVILRVNKERQTRRLVGENTVEWRGVLRAGTLGVSIEVGGGGQAAGGVPVGVLELQLELLPAQATLGDEEVADQLAAERSNAVAAEREFLVYARRWWGEYLATSEVFQRRHVKVFASVQAHAARAACVTTFVAPLRADRVLASPLLSARYVSLLTYDKDDPAAALPLTAAAGGGGGSGVGPAAWAPSFPFVATGKGGEAEHANLLCSLLLGHGLDAWVVLGVDAANHHKTCVVTRAGELSAGAPPPLRSSHLVTYWDVLTGVRYKVPNPHVTGAAAADAVGCNDVAVWEGGMAAVHCAYTADAFVANVQGEASVQSTSFDFSSEEQWKAMNPIKLRMVHKSPVPALLRPHVARGGAAAVEVLEQRLERAIVERIAAYRGDLGFPTLWDHETLPHILSQALYNYEHQKVTNVALDASMFQCAIKGAIRKGQHCKAFPVNFTHSSPSRIFKHFVSNRHTSDIIELVGDDVCESEVKEKELSASNVETNIVDKRFATHHTHTHTQVRHSLRVKITPYAEEALSAWVMLAAVYSS